ncbi:QRIC2 protein, partial [Atlantisia rogersi]|nr:QRIC2 protein [Atlantisia rogersi]
EGELLKHLQATLTQVEGDYRELSTVTGNLVGDLRQKDRDIEALFQSLARLEKDKADKEELSLAIDAKADKSALAGKVSHSQFDACVERLTETMQESISQVTGLEQDWLQVQRQLRQELDAKVDRLELGPFRLQLEEHWKNILEQLQKSLTPGAEDAAGIKKQLPQDFKCLSCDRPVSVLVPGP